MEQALQAIYEKGKADGKPEVPEKVRIRQGVTLAADAVVHALEETKGSEQSAGKKYYSGSGTMRTKNGGDTMSGLMFPKIKTKKKRKSHAKSILQDKEDKRCYLCMLLYGDNSIKRVQEHHICFGTANHAKAEEMGLKVNLCAEKTS